MGLFDVWDTFTDFVGDWWKAFKDKIWDIKCELWSWVDDIAKYWVERADQFFDILKHSWWEVEDLYWKARSYADDIVTDAILKIDTWIQTFGESIAELWDRLEPYITPLISPLENAINQIENIKIPSLEDLINTTKGVVDKILEWDIPFLNQSIKDLWAEADKIWNKIWEIPDDVWKAICGGWDALTDFLLAEGEKFIEKILDIDIPIDNVIEDLERKFKGGEK